MKTFKELELALVKELEEEISKVLDEPREFGIQREVLRLAKYCLTLKKDMHLTKGLSTVKFAIGNYLKDRVLKNDLKQFLQIIYSPNDRQLFREH